MDALRRKDGPQKRNAKKGEKSRLMERNIGDCSVSLLALRKKWMGPITNLETCVALVVMLCSRCHEKRGRDLQIIDKIDICVVE
jgi:hypothetical protein